MTTPVDFMKLTQFLLPMVQSGDPAQIDQAAGLLAQKGAVNPQQFFATLQGGNAPVNMLGETGKLPTLNPGTIAFPPTPPVGTPPIVAKKEEAPQDKTKDLLTKFQELSAGITTPAAPVTPAPPVAPAVTPPGVGGVSGVNIEQILQQILGRGGVPAPNPTFGQLLLGQ